MSFGSFLKVKSFSLLNRSLLNKKRNLQLQLRKRNRRFPNPWRRKRRPRNRKPNLRR